MSNIVLAGLFAALTVANAWNYKRAKERGATKIKKVAGGLVVANGVGTIFYTVKAIGNESTPQ